jgi:hypothetical protein
MPTPRQPSRLIASPIFSTPQDPLENQKASCRLTAMFWPKSGTTVTICICALMTG